jgi:hypothetical protein
VKLAKLEIVDGALSRAVFLAYSLAQLPTDIHENGHEGTASLGLKAESFFSCSRKF